MPGRGVRPWPGAPDRWPRRRPQRGVCCFSLRRPYSVPDSTAAVARSFDSSASSVPTRSCDAFAVRRSRAFSFVNALSAVFRRRDRRRALRNSASAWTFAAATALRSRATSLRSDISVPRGCGSTPASPSSRVRRATSASSNSAFFAARRASFASSTAASRLRRASLNCHFNEPAALRATTSAHFNSSARASAASARSRVCSYSRRQSGGVRTKAPSAT